MAILSNFVFLKGFAASEVSFLLSNQLCFLPLKATQLSKNFKSYLPKKVNYWKKYCHSSRKIFNSFISLFARYSVLNVKNYSKITIKSDEIVKFAKNQHSRKQSKILYFLLITDNPKNWQDRKHHIYEIWTEKHNRTAYDQKYHRHS